MSLSDVCTHVTSVGPPASPAQQDQHGRHGHNSDQSAQALTARVPALAMFALCPLCKVFVELVCIIEGEGVMIHMASTRNRVLHDLPVAVAAF